MNNIPEQFDNWLKSSIAIALIFICRMQGLFLLIPVFSVMALNLADATPFLVGLAMGVYGLSQAMMQIPFGYLSDKFGRKSLIIIGLLLFIIGSILGIFANNIWWIIVARFIQGLGAVGGVLIALLSDITPENKRTQAMAVVGASIGLSFMLAMLIAPILTKVDGLATLFSVMAGLGIIGIVILILCLPKKPPQLLQHNVKLSVSKSKLWPLNAGIFFQHLILTANFFVLPIVLKNFIKLDYISNMWSFYVPNILIAFILVFPIIRIAEKNNNNKFYFNFFVVVATISQGLLAFVFNNYYIFLLISGVYFIAFNYLEATLPSMISKLAPPDQKGAAMGVYSTSQFLGIFLGGLLAGSVYHLTSIPGVFLCNSAIGMLWVLLITMRL
jgi:MFS family permease